MFGWLKQNEKKSNTKLKTTTFSISGMHCTSCALVIDDALEEVSGIHAAKTEYARSRVSVEYDPAQATVKAIKQAIAEQGYEVTGEIME